MPNFLEWNSLSWRDAVDIFVVAVVLYYILLAIRGTRAVQILLGIVILLGVQALSFYLKLQSTYFVLRGLVLSIVVALPIVFQPELRRALMQLGGSMKFQHVRHDVLVKIVDEISWAAHILSQTRTGALIAVERETGLEEYIENGVEINAEISGRLLLSIFQKTSPLHDGAVILRGDKVVAASCYLPLSEARQLTRAHTGTRHRAALGLSEQTDAVVVVVSEETGEITIVHGGQFSHHDGDESLKRHLLERLQAAAAPATSSSAQLRAWIPWRRQRTREQAAVTISTDTPAERVEVEAARPPLPRQVPSEAPELDEEAIAEKQRQIEKAVEARASEARRREERRKDDEARRPDGEPAKPESEEPAAAPPTAGAPRPPHAAPIPPRVEDRLQGRQ